MKKRALSSVITTVLIVLLTVAAIGIAAVVILNSNQGPINQVSEEFHSLLNLIGHNETAVAPQTEICGDGADNDGDDYIDEGCENVLLEPLILCGDGKCLGEENVNNCLSDCAGDCGDGICNPRTEDHFDCSSDCDGKYYVVDLHNSQCSNSGPGNLTRPFCHINAPFSILNPTDTVYVRGGKQNFSSFARITRGGTPENYVTIRNYPGEKPIFDSGYLFGSDWTLVEENSEYRIYSSNNLLGTDITKYPTRIYLDLNNPFSTVFSLDDLRTKLKREGIEDYYDAMFIDCSYGKIYLRLTDSSTPAPNRTNIHFGGESQRFYIWAPYVRIVGFTIQHGVEGLKLQKPDPLSFKNITSLELYDNTFRSLRDAIGDHISAPNDDNYFIVHNNTFLNIGPKAIIELLNSRTYSISGTIRCASDDGVNTTFKRVDGEGKIMADYVVANATGDEAYHYVSNRWTHVIYGTALGVQFSGNYVNTGGPNTAISTTRHSRYLNNVIYGDLIGGGFNDTIYGDAVGENLLIANNFILNRFGWALHLNGVIKSIKIVNNILIGREVGTATDGTTALIIMGYYNKIKEQEVTIKNNLIIDLNESDAAYCFSFFGNKNTSILDFNNNYYAGCNGWLFGDNWYSGTGNRHFFLSKPTAEENFNDWRDFLQLTFPDIESNSKTLDSSQIVSEENFEVLRTSTPAELVDKGGLVSRLHCPRADDDSSLSMEAKISCLHWRGDSVDVGLLD